MTNAKPYFRLFANCIPVKGATRSTICDLQRNTYRFIPTLFYEILAELQEQTIEAVKASYNHQYDQGIDHYLELLVKSEWGFWTDEPTRFPAINLQWSHSATITNAIIDINQQSNHKFEKIHKELDELGCKALELRIYHQIFPPQLHQILDAFQFSRLQFIALNLPYTSEWTEIAMKSLVEKYPRVQQMIFHTAPKDAVHQLSAKVPLNVVFTSAIIDSKYHCGIVNPMYFSPNLSHFTEAQKHNTCLNRKISIDQDGNIKNCPSMEKSYGNHRESSLKDAVQKKHFREVWSIHKDQITTCKDCEFRYICTDCRAYVEDIYSKPKKCGYNPYTAKWEGEHAV